VVEEGSLPGELVQGQVYSVKALLANNTDRDLKLQVPHALPVQSYHMRNPFSRLCNLVMTHL
jgi:hypothetical protein